MTITKNTPFIFRFDIENDKKVSELIDMTYKFNDNNKLVRKKTSDPAKPWANVGWESKLDVFTDFKHFDVSFEYDNDLTQVQINEIERKWYKVDTQKEGTISVKDDKLEEIAKNVGLTKLHDLYFDLIKKPLTKNHIISMKYDPVNFTVSLEDFKNYFKREYDENLPTILLVQATYSTVLFNKLFWKSTKVAKLFQKEFEVKAKSLPAQF